VEACGGVAPFFRGAVDPRDHLMNHLFGCLAVPHQDPVVSRAYQDPIVVDSDFEFPLQTDRGAGPGTTPQARARCAPASASHLRIFGFETGTVVRVIVLSRWPIAFLP